MRINKTFDIKIEGKEVRVGLSKRAFSSVNSATSPVYIGLEIYFSCFVKKIIVSFDVKPDRDLYKVHDNLYVYFRPVQSKSCNIHDLKGTNSPTLIDFPVIKRIAIIPSAVQLDFTNNKWTGDFTWKRTSEKNLVH